jgi:hypothetical protein
VARVLDQEQAVGLGQRGERGEVARLAREVDRDDRAGARADQRRDRGRVEVAGDRIDVREPDTEPGLVRRRGGGREGDRRGDELVARRQAEPEVGQVQRRGAVDAGRDVVRAQARPARPRRRRPPGRR